MKNLRIFEAAVIGFFIGVVVSAYILFMNTSGREIGGILEVVSLVALLKYFPPEYTNSIVFHFLFYVFVYTLYLVLINLLSKINKKISVLIFIIVIILMGGTVFQQIQSFKQPPVSNNEITHVPSVPLVKEIKKYFGQEAIGDLNNDTVDDVAFLIKRNDGDERGDMYYLSSSLKKDNEYQGLNLLYIDNEINIKNFYIQDGVIFLEYSKNDSDEIENYMAKVSENILTQFFEDEKEDEDVEQEVSENTE